MVEVPIARGWDLEVDRGPDWLFVRPCRIAGNNSDVPQFAELIWSLLEQNFTHRLVLELGNIEHLDSQMIGQLIWLNKRIHACDGMLRICGLSEHNVELLATCHLGGYFPHYRDREAAVMGRARPTQPR